MFTLSELERRLEGQPPEVIDAIAGMAIEGFDTTGSAGARALRQAMAIVARALVDSPAAFAPMVALAANPGASASAAFLVALEEAIERARIKAFQALPADEQFDRVVAMYDALPEGDHGDDAAEAAWEASKKPGARRMGAAELESLEA